MDKEILEKYIEQGMSTNQIAREVNKSQCSVRHWLKKYGLKTKHKQFPKEKQEQKSEYYCRLCDKTKPLNEFYVSKSKVHSYCKKCNNAMTYNKQKERKIAAVNYKGGKCQICGYSRYVGALDFHHLDPNQKEYQISDLRSYSLEVMKTELDKCICVCRNCHAEIHHGLIDLKEYARKDLNLQSIPYKENALR